MDLLIPLTSLRSKRSIFHSEADFQFALAWEIQSTYEDAIVRLEYCPKDHPNIHLDILVEYNEKWYPIELKYKTVKLKVEVEGECFNLKSHGAQPLGRYDFWIDVERVELMRNSMGKFERGYVIMLSNDSSYWNSPKSSKESCCEHFRIHNGNKCGLLSWTGKPSSGTTKNRESDINLSSNYRLEWSEFSTLSLDSNGTFKYLMLEV